MCDKTTGHVEVVQVTFDPETIDYRDLVDWFWHVHSPCQGGGQGWNIGENYRPVIFYHDDEQRRQAEASKAQFVKDNHVLRPIATSIEPAAKFWPAEKYHQQYYEKKGAPPPNKWPGEKN